MLHKIDIFGSPFNIFIINDSIEYQTKIGGIYTISAILSTIIFGSLKINNWALGNLSQTIVSYGQSIENQLICNMTENLVNIKLYNKQIEEKSFYFVPIL